MSIEERELRQRCPLQVVVVRLGEADHLEPFARAVRAALLDSPVNGGAAGSGGELLQGAELRDFSAQETAPGSLPNKELLERIASSSDRVLFVLLNGLDEGTERLPHSPTAAEQHFLDAAKSLRPEMRAVLCFYLKSDLELFETSPSADGVTRLGLPELDERDLQLPFVGLHVLHHALVLFCREQSIDGSAPVRLFFSHAKRDGVPLTTAVRDWMRRLKGFGAFYDTENLDVHGDLERQLESAITNAIVVAFRSDVFDQRYWCQKELLWAERHRRPLVTVDARLQVAYRPSVINFDITPVVRIPDGSVVRILSAALLEALRIELFRARSVSYAEFAGIRNVVAVPRYPSLVSLAAACDELATAANGDPAYVVYPNPAMPAMLAEAVESLVEARPARCEVLSFDEFVLRAGAR